MYNLKKYLIALVLFNLVTNLFAKETYLNELVSGSKISFQHWNTEESKITGYSFFQYEKISKNGKQFILEKNENTKPDGKVFTKKSLWFDASYGIPQIYEEEDFRKDYRIKNIYSGKIVKTYLFKEGKTLEFETDIGSVNAVPLEIFFFFLRKNFKKILIKEDFYFTLFLPLLAMELEEKGLPSSMSMVQMKTEIGEGIVIDTPLGLTEARELIVYPKSGLLRALLPREKTNFEFVIAESPPHHILQFKIGKTRHILQELHIPD